MVRPRLVEEGVPVGSGATEEHVLLEDHSMDDGSVDHHHGQSNNQHHYAATQASHLTPSNTKDHASNQYKSSLQQACGNKSFQPRPKRSQHATRVVIGREQAAADDCYHHPQRQDQVRMHSTHYTVSSDHGTAAVTALPPPVAHRLQWTEATGPLQPPPFHHHFPYNHHHHNYNNNTHITGPPAHATHMEIHGGIPGAYAYPVQQPLIPSPLPDASIQNSHHHHYHPQHYQQPSAGPPAVKTHLEIGADDRPTERMEGVEDHSLKAPLVVLDGANIAYAYSQTLQGGPSLATAATYSKQSALQPNARGIHVASDYFVDAGLRLLIVLPQSWFRTRNNISSTNSSSSSYQPLLITGLQDLQQRYGDKIVAAPPTDDDDAYALVIARRETLRVNPHYRHETTGAPLQGHGFVVSNDLFRDAIARDTTQQLQEWLRHGVGDGTGAGRISYAFCDMGSMDEYGDRMLDFVPNPRHELVAHIEASRLISGSHSSL